MISKETLSHFVRFTNWIFKVDFHDSVDNTYILLDLVNYFNNPLIEYKC